MPTLPSQHWTYMERCLVANHTIEPKTGALSIGGQPVDLRVLQDLVLDATGAFYNLVLTYLVASAGLTPVYDAKNYPAFMNCVFRLMPATSSGACRASIPVHAGPPFRSMPAGGV